MYIENFNGIRRFTVISIENQYSLREQRSGDIILSPFESLKDADGARRNAEGIIVPGQTLSLFCKWNGRWCVSPLRPYQKRDLATIDAIEDNQNEFKENGLYSLSEDVAAFANSEGGTIWWGVDDQATICGLELLIERYGGKDRFSSFVRNKIKQTLNTLLFLSVRLEYIEQAGHTVLKIIVPKSHDIVLVKGESLYIRSDNTTQKLTGDNLISYFKMKLNAQKDKAI